MGRSDEENFGRDEADKFEDSSGGEDYDFSDDDDEEESAEASRAKPKQGPSGQVNKANNNRGSHKSGVKKLTK